MVATRCKVNSDVQPPTTPGRHMQRKRKHARQLPVCLTNSSVEDARASAFTLGDKKKKEKYRTQSQAAASRDKGRKITLLSCGMVEGQTDGLIVEVSNILLNHKTLSSETILSINPVSNRKGGI